MNYRTPHAASQSGAALMIAMVMIFMLTILGVSSMRASNMERRLTSNAILTSTTFKAAESSTDMVLNDSENLSSAWAANDGIIQESPDLKSTSDVSISVDLSYVGDGAAPGYSLGASSGGFMSLRFDALGTATLDAVNAESNVRQGAYRIVPSP